MRFQQAKNLVGAGFAGLNAEKAGRRTETGDTIGTQKAAHVVWGRLSAGKGDDDHGAQCYSQPQPERELEQHDQPPSWLIVMGRSSKVQATPMVSKLSYTSHHKSHPISIIIKFVISVEAYRRLVMAKTVVALYDDFDVAQDVVEDLLQAGFSRENISLMASDTTGEYARRYVTERVDEDVTAGEGAGFGAVVGTLIGLGV